MGEVRDIVDIYLKENEVLEDKAKAISATLQSNIRSNLWKGHGYDTGQLYGDITTDWSTVTTNTAIVEGMYTVSYGQYVDKGHHSWPGINFMEKGLKKTLEMYKG